jgi:signal transduction histidine kinase
LSRAGKAFFKPGLYMDEQRHLFYSVIHDLKNPIGAIMGLSDIFLKVLSLEMNENQRDVIRKIKSYSEFALTLMEDLLDLESISRGALTIHKEMVDIPTLLQPIIQDNKMRATVKNIILKYELLQPVTLPVDKTRFQQIMNNLLTNAIKFSYPGSVVEISDEVVDGYVLIRIKDTGVGIPEEDFPNLFKPFAPVASIPTANEKKTGVGLSIVKKLVELHQGDVEVTSVVNQGSTFTVKLPLQG